MTKKQKIAYYILLVIISLLFLSASIPKLLALPVEVQGFAQAGLPVWFMYVIGIGELCGVVGLWTRKFFRYAYEGLFIVLAGAFGTTWAFMGFLLALLPLAAAVALGFIVWLDGKRRNAASTA